MPRLNEAARAVLEGQMTWTIHRSDECSSRRMRELARVHKDRLFQEQDGLCFYCQQLMVLDVDTSGNPRLCTVDHVLPLSRGGDNSPENLVAACRACNQWKGNWYPE